MVNRLTGRLLLAFAVLGLVVCPGCSQAPTATEQELITVENEWGEAVLKSDVPALERLYADEYVAIDSRGAVYTKAQDIADIKSGDYKLTAYKFDDTKVRLYGDVAVVTGRTTSTASYKGEDIGGVHRYTDVFVKRDGRWQVVSTQGTRVVAP